MHAMTVLGPVDAAQLGVVLPHEHIMIDLRHHAFSVEAILDDPDLAVDELQRFRTAGGGTVVDLTNRYMGRSVETQVRVAAFGFEQPAQLIAAAGEDMFMFCSDYPHAEGMSDPITYVDDLEGLPEEDKAKIMGGNLAGLMNVGVPA